MITSKNKTKQKQQNKTKMQEKGKWNLGVSLNNAFFGISIFEFETHCEQGTINFESSVKGLILSTNV